MFLRAKNNGRNDGLENPDGDLAVGTFQLDKTRRPRNTAFSTNSDSHNHGITRNSYEGGAGGGAGGPGWSSENSQILSGVTFTTNSDSHSHSITGGGDNETNPRNITVNVYVKVDD